MGIPDPESRLGAYPHQLSGGQRQRVMIAMALANEPDLLIADEPTTALDVTVQAQILKLLKQLQARLGMAMLFITHDLGIVRKIADRVCVMQKGQSSSRVKPRPPSSPRSIPTTQALLKAEPKPDPAPAAPDAPIVVSAKDLKVHFPIKRGILRRTVGHVKAVDGVSVAIHQGETLGVVGESGSGKTTLGLALLRLISSQGPIAFLGQRIDGLKFAACVPCGGTCRSSSRTPMARSRRACPSPTSWARASASISRSSAMRSARRESSRLWRMWGLIPRAAIATPHEFSGGQRQRISIARAMALEPSFVVLDEPTSALDMLVQAQIVDLLRALQRKRNLTYMFISHDLRVVSALASRILVMRHGKVVEEGPARDVFEHPREAYTKALFAAAFNLDTTHAAAVAQ